MRRTAFTLLELLIVLAIIISISAIGISGYQRQYARSQFKSGVVQLQVDLLSVRLLAMRSGDAYVFRYVPGSSIYEIAPLKTLQEVLYRANGDYSQEDDVALGGSLNESGGNFSYETNSGTYGSSIGYGNAAPFDDDLFSEANIKADLENASRANEREARLGTSNVNYASGLGGGLNASASTSPMGAASATGASVVYGQQGLSGSGLSGSPSLDGTSNWDTYSSSNDNELSYAINDDYSGMGDEFTLSSDMNFGEERYSTTIRALNSYEKTLANENTIAWRVNADGAILRKQTKGDVIFTFMRVSNSTPSNLRAHRPGGVKNSQTTSGLSVNEGEDLGSTLGGSLRSIPSAVSNGEGIGGSLNKNSEDDEYSDLAVLEEEQTPVSMWSDPLVFYPNGKTSNAVIGFACVGEYSFYSEIALRGMTGVARISSISAIPPGMDMAGSALTQEQLFRLSNPGVAYSENDDLSVQTSGGALASASQGSAGEKTNSLTDNLPNNEGESSSNTNAASAATISYGTSKSSEIYGSQDGRSGYQFNSTLGSDSGTNNNIENGSGISIGEGKALNGGVQENTNTSGTFENSTSVNVDVNNRRTGGN